MDNSGYKPLQVESNRYPEDRRGLINSLDEDDENFREGDAVDALWAQDGLWHPATVMLASEDGTFLIEWEDYESDGTDTLKKRDELRHSLKPHGHEWERMFYKYWWMVTCITIGLIFEVVLVCALVFLFGQSWATLVFFIMLFLRMTTFCCFRLITPSYHPRTICSWEMVRYSQDQLGRSLTEGGRLSVYLMVMLPFVIWLPWLDSELVHNCSYVPASTTGTVDVEGSTVQFHTIACGTDGSRLTWPLPWLALMILCIGVLYAKMYYKSGIPAMSITLLTNLRRVQILVVNVFDCCLFCIRPFQLDGFLVLKNSLIGDWAGWLFNSYLVALGVAYFMQLVATTVYFSSGQRNRLSVTTVAVSSLLLNIMFLVFRCIVWYKGVDMEWFLLFKNGVLIVYDFLDLLHICGSIDDHTIKAMEDTFDFMPGCYDFNNWVLNSTASELIVIDPDLTPSDKMLMLAFMKVEHIQNVMPWYPLQDYDKEPGKKLVEIDDTGDMEVWREADRWRTKVSNRKDAPTGFTRPNLPDVDEKRRGCELPFMNWSVADAARKQKAQYTEFVGEENGHVGMPFNDSQWRVVPTQRAAMPKHIHQVSFIQSALKNHLGPSTASCTDYACMGCRSTFYVIYMVLATYFCLLLTSVFESSVYWLAWIILGIQIILAISVASLLFFTTMGKDEFRIAMFLVCLLPMCVYLPWLNASIIDKCQYDATGAETPSDVCYVVDSDADKLKLMNSFSSTSVIGGLLSYIESWFGLAFLYKKALYFFLPLSYLLAFFNSGSQLVASRISGNHRQSEMLVVDFFDICIYATVPWQLKGYLFFELYSGVKLYYLLSLSLVFLIEIVGASLVYGIRLFPGSCTASFYARSHNVPVSLARSTLPAKHPDPRLISGMSLVLNFMVLIFRLLRVFWWWHGVSVELLLLLKNILCMLYDCSLLIQWSTPEFSEYMRMPLDMIANILPDVGSLSRETAMEVLKGGRLPLEDRREGAKILSYNKRDWEELFFQDAIVETQASVQRTITSMNYNDLGREGGEQATPLNAVSSTLKDNLYYFTEGMGEIPSPLNGKLLRLIDTRSTREPKVFRQQFPQQVPTNYEKINNEYTNPTIPFHKPKEAKKAAAASSVSPQAKALGF